VKKFENDSVVDELKVATGHFLTFLLVMCNSSSVLNFFIKDTISSSVEGSKLQRDSFLSFDSTPLKYLLSCGSKLTMVLPVKSSKTSSRVGIYWFNKSKSFIFLIVPPLIVPLIMTVCPVNFLFLLARLAKLAFKTAFLG
jgi:hypothetical protein